MFTYRLTTHVYAPENFTVEILAWNWRDKSPKTVLFTQEKLRQSRLLKAGMKTVQAGFNF